MTLTTIFGLLQSAMMLLYVAQNSTPELQKQAINFSYQAVEMATQALSEAQFPDGIPNEQQVQNNPSLGNATPILPQTTVSVPQITQTSTDIGNPYNDSKFGYKVNVIGNNVQFLLQPNGNTGDDDNLTMKIEVTMDGITKSGKSVEFQEVASSSHEYSLKYFRGNKFGILTDKIDVK